MNRPKTEMVSNLRFLSEQRVPLKQLAGFKKHHRVPDSIDRGYQQYLGEIVAAEINADLETHFSALRSAFGLKRKQISVNGPVDGAGTISTPWFNYEIFVAGDETDPSQVIWQRLIGDILQIDPIFSPESASVFQNRFSVLEVLPDNGFDLESIVDHVEDAEPDSVTVDYDKDLTWCEIGIEGSGAQIKITPKSIRVSSRQEMSPQELMDAFLDIQSQFISALGS